MGRDWTPRETYAEDDCLQFEGKTIRTQIRFIHADGSKEKISKIDDRTYKRFPELCFLFNEGLYSIIMATKQHPKIRNKILDEIESKIVYYEKHPYEVKDTDITWLWFNGELDKDFYYNRENNRIFAEYIMEEYNKRANKKYTNKEGINKAVKESNGFDDFIHCIENKIRKTKCRLIQIIISDPEDSHGYTTCSIKYTDKNNRPKSQNINVSHIFRSSKYICRDKILIKRNVDDITIEIKNRQIITKDGTNYMSFEHSKTIDYNKTKDFNSRLTNDIICLIGDLGL